MRRTLVLIVAHWIGDTSMAGAAFVVAGVAFRTPLTVRIRLGAAQPATVPERCRSVPSFVLGAGDISVMEKPSAAGGLYMLGGRTSTPAAGR